MDEGGVRICVGGDQRRTGGATAVSLASVAGAGRELIIVESRFDTALHHKLVKPVPSRSGPAGDDVEPSGFLFSADYRTPSELRKITEGNEESRQLLTKNNSLNAERHALLTCVLPSSTPRRLADSPSQLSAGYNEQAHLRFSAHARWSGSHHGCGRRRSQRRHATGSQLPLVLLLSWD